MVSVIDTHEESHEDRSANHTDLIIPGFPLSAPGDRESTSAPPYPKRWCSELGGDLLAAHSEEYPLVTNEHRRRVLNPSEVWSAVKACIRSRGTEAVRRNPVSALAVIPLDRRGTVLAHAPISADARGELKCLSLIDPESPEYEALYTHRETLLLYTCVILANIFDPWMQRFKEHCTTKLAAAWEGGPGEIIWIDEADTSPSRGACLPHSEYFCSLILREREESAEPAA